MLILLILLCDRQPQLLIAMRLMSFHSYMVFSPWYCDETIQPVIERALTEWDREKLIALGRQVMAYNHDQAPVLYMHESVTYFVLAPGGASIAM